MTGSYHVDQQVLVTNRSNGGAPGFWVLTPLVQADGTAVVVNRGWIPFSYTEEGPWTDFDPPTGTVSVLGMVRVPQSTAPDWCPARRDAGEGVLRSLARVDVGRLQQQVDEQLLPLYVDLRAQQPAQDGALPEPIPGRSSTRGPHLNYAGQWFIFALLTMIVLPAAAALDGPPADGAPARPAERDRRPGRRARGPEGDGGLTTGDGPALVVTTPADTRERVLDAALGCIEREGLAATSVEDVARAASVSRATIYRHFPAAASSC